MEQINNAIDKWILTKISQYKADQLKMTIEEASHSDLYATRQKTIDFLTRELTKRLNVISAAA